MWILQVGMEPSSKLQHKYPFQATLFYSIGKISPKVEIQNSSFQNEVILEVII
jgi:hypothetical protein